MVAEKLLKIRLDLPHSRLIESEADKVGLLIRVFLIFLINDIRS